MPYGRTLPSGLVVRPTRATDGQALEKLQEIVFPRLAPEERFHARHYRKHVVLFPEGQFVAADGDRVVGMTSSIRYDFDFAHADHTFAEIIAGGYLTSHQPEGAWLYGVDMGTHPDYRRRGVARGLYEARQDTVQRLGLKGQVTVGMMNGYGAVADRMSPEAYFAGVRDGTIIDPTVSAQMRVGFKPRALVRGYVSDPTCAGCGILIILEA